MPEGGLVIIWQLGASSVFPWRVCKGVRRCQGGLFVVIRQLGASSSSPGGSIKMFIDAQGGLFNHMAVRCQLLFLWRVRKGICRCQRGL
jgi:hypothetical protein